ncbi:uncharacterized protein [Aegilops tauschii subsp. strangulata]|uniref:uncharacterized protein n=1 Tax=Aegilops tauschii subsp. strangulata TaxID=200361 RepID=UPI00098BA588|nr:ethylene-responsive transcription factor ERF010-like [Aegilops tauschii subsp. strangulata]
MPLGMAVYSVLLNIYQQDEAGCNLLHMAGSFASAVRRSEHEATNLLATRPLRRSSSSRFFFLASPLPRHRGSSGYGGVHARPSGVFYAEIRSDETRLGLGTFGTSHEATHAYDAAAWRLRRPRRETNFPEVATRELAPPPWLVTDEDRRINRRRERRLGIAEMDEEAMAVWRQCFPEDVANEREIYAQRRADRAAYHEDRRTRKADALFNVELKEVSSWDSNDERWIDAFITT